MVNKKYAQPNIKCLSTMLLGLRAATLSRKKGIKVGPGETFRYRNKAKSKRSLVYLYEAGLHPDHAKTLELGHIIKIYVKRDGEGTVLLGFLSAARPWIRLELTLGEDCELTHTSPRKAVFFNGFRLTLAKSPKSKLLPNREVWRRAKSVTMQANKELWVVEVRPSQKLRFNPGDEGKEYHLLEVYSRENTNENIGLHVVCNKGMQSVGELVVGCNRTGLNSVFDDVFTLSHTSNTTSVFFSGYTVPNQSSEFKLKELNKNTEDPKKDSLKSPKISLDPEYMCYKGILIKMPADTPRQQPTGTPKRAEVNLLSLSPLTAPLIFNHRASCEIFSATPRGFFWVPKQEDIGKLLSPPVP